MLETIFYSLGSVWLITQLARFVRCRPGAGGLPQPGADVAHWFVERTDGADKATLGGLHFHCHAFKLVATVRHEKY